MQGRLTQACGVMCSVGYAIDSGARAMSQGAGNVEAAEEITAKRRRAWDLAVYGDRGH